MSGDGHGGHQGPQLGDGESILSLAARVTLFVALLGLGADHLVRGRAQDPTAHADVAHSAGVEPSALAPAPSAMGAAAVAAASPEASRAGALMLSRNGNAFDAVVAASFAVCVTRPHATGIGGGGFALLHLGATQRRVALDGRETAPASASRDMYAAAPGDATIGPRAGGVPGFVALMYALHRDRGKLPWADVLSEAIRLARDGFQVDAGLAAAVEKKRDELARFPSSASVFLPGGHPVRVGDLLRQPDLARTLERIANDGLAGFYAGETAERIAAATPITKADLAGYKVVTRAPISGTFQVRRGERTVELELVSMPPPSSGGVVLLQALRVLGGLDLEAARAAGDGADLHLVAETLRRGFADRAEHMGDPDHVEVPSEWLCSAARADQIRAGIDPARATPSRLVRPGSQQLESDHTTHVSVIDRDGNAVAVTHTINLGLGSCFVVPGTGILLNDEMDDFATRPGQPNAFGLMQGEKNAVAPGKRPLSSMTPLLVLEGGEVVGAIGSPGGPRIISAVLQVFLNVFQARLAPDAAVAAPRLHHQWEPDWLYLEDGVAPRAVEGLARRGHKVRQGERVGEVQAVFRLDAETVMGVSDPRGTGRPEALPRD